MIQPEKAPAYAQQVLTPLILGGLKNARKHVSTLTSPGRQALSAALATALAPLATMLQTRCEREHDKLGAIVIETPFIEDLLMGTEADDSEKRICMFFLNHASGALRGYVHDTCMQSLVASGTMGTREEAADRADLVTSSVMGDFDKLIALDRVRIFVNYQHREDAVGRAIQSLGGNKNEMFQRWPFEHEAQAFGIDLPAADVWLYDFDQKNYIQFAITNDTQRYDEAFPSADDDPGVIVLPTEGEIDEMSIKKLRAWIEKGGRARDLVGCVEKSDLRALALSVLEQLRDNTAATFKA